MADYPPTKMHRDNYRLLVDVSDPWLLAGDEDKRHEERMRAAEDLKRKIQRHVDGYGMITIELDALQMCAYCGRPWEDPPHCCIEAQGAAILHGIEYEDEDIDPPYRARAIEALFEHETALAAPGKYDDSVPRRERLVAWNEWLEEKHEGVKT